MSKQERLEQLRKEIFSYRVTEKAYRSLDENLLFMRNLCTFFEHSDVKEPLCLEIERQRLSLKETLKATEETMQKFPLLDMFIPKTETGKKKDIVKKLVLEASPDNLVKYMEVRKEENLVLCEGAYISPSYRGHGIAQDDRKTNSGRLSNVNPAEVGLLKMAVKKGVSFTDGEWKRMTNA